MKVDENKEYGCLDLHYENDVLHFRKLLGEHYIDFHRTHCTTIEAMRFLVSLFEYVVKPDEIDKVFKVNDEYVQVRITMLHNMTYLGLRVASEPTDLHKTEWCIFQSYLGNPIKYGLRDYIITLLSFT